MQSSFRSLANHWRVGYANAYFSSCIKHEIISYKVQKNLIINAKLYTILNASSIWYVKVWTAKICIFHTLKTNSFIQLLHVFNSVFNQ